MAHLAGEGASAPPLAQARPQAVAPLRTSSTAPSPTARPRSAPSNACGLGEDGGGGGRRADAGRRASTAGWGTARDGWSSRAAGAAAHLEQRVAHDLSGPQLKNQRLASISAGLDQLSIDREQGQARSACGNSCAG
jgi:hypothetical protein